MAAVLSSFGKYFATPAPFDLTSPGAPRHNTSPQLVPLELVENNPLLKVATRPPTTRRRAQSAFFG